MELIQKLENTMEHDANIQVDDKMYTQKVHV